ncbi:efflux transporter outer membrane subunit [Sphingobium algorifonticola]|uniref:efflux transporter outer membrane subunit n=1 Tax=Sphingobium algorifonticola TaxID=2008318 RepID=UPI001F49A38E|nr:TolC family protein [Sphingobium algorifonticola]
MKAATFTLRTALAFASALALSACAVGPDYRPPASLPADQARLAELSGTTAVTDAPAATQWWHLFEDPALDRLVAKALAHNTDLRVAAANVRRARGLLSEARAAALPTTTTSGQFTRSRNVVNFGQGLTGFTQEVYTAGLDASYELDLFGGVRRSIEASRGDIGAAEAALDAARVSVAAETALTYANACATGAQAQVARDTLALQEKTLDLTRRLLAGGRNTQRDVDQSVVLVEQARAQAAGFEAERRASLYALAVLTGEPPASFDAAAAACVTPPAVRAPIAVGDGQALLARRPDVRQAERQLAADTARIGVATAALYPSISLLGSVTTTGLSPSDLGTSDSFGYSVGPLISWNFPFSGAARARVRQNKAIAEGSLASFDKAVLTALQETEQALARLKGAIEREEALSRALKASESAAFIAEKRFGAGSDSFLQLLDAQRSRADARAAYADAQAARAESQVALFKALGGGWEGAPQPVAAGQEPSGTR